MFSLVLPDFDSRLKNQIEFVRNLFKRELESLFKERFFSLNIDPDEKIKCTYVLVDNILSNLPLIKFETLQHQANIDILLVSKLFQEIWSEEISKYRHHTNFKNTKVLNCKDFFEKESDCNKQKDIYLYSGLGFSDQ